MGRATTPSSRRGSSQRRSLRSTPDTELAAAVAWYGRRVREETHAMFLATVERLKEELYAEPPALQSSGPWMRWIMEQCRYHERFLRSSSANRAKGVAVLAALEWAGRSLGGRWATSRASCAAGNTTSMAGIAPRVSDRVDLEYHRTVEREEGREHLTSMEADVLRYLWQAGRTVSREELLAKVWGYSDSVMSHAPATPPSTGCESKSRSNPSNPEVILPVHGAGYRIASAEEPVARPVLTPRTSEARRYRLRRIAPSTSIGCASRRALAPSPCPGGSSRSLEALVGVNGAAIERSVLQRRIWGGRVGAPALDNTIARLTRKLEPREQPRTLPPHHRPRLSAQSYTPQSSPRPPPLRRQPSHSVAPGGA